MTGIYVDQPGLRRVKSMLHDRKTRIVFMPLFKTYADALIMFLVNYVSDLELGFSFGNYEDSPKAAVVESLLKRIGYFLLRRVQNDTTHPEHSYISQALIQEVIASNPITTIF